MKHSIFSASGAERWANCPGSIAFCEGIKSTDSDASREGTAGHALADHCLRHDTWPGDYVGHVFEKYEITDDLAEAVSDYVEYVRGISGIRLSEVRVYYANLLGVDDDEAFGTSDALIVAGHILHVIDAKFGRRFVDPKKNKQMMLYAAGALEALKAVGEADDITEIQLHIMQPRVTSKPLPYIMSRADLDLELEWLAERAALVIEAQFNYLPASPLWQEKYPIPGEYQCQWCPAAAACPSLRTRAKSVTPMDEFELVNSLEALPSSTVAENMALVPLLELWIKAVEHEGFRRLTRGDVVPGYKLVTGREGNRKWQNEDVVLEAFSELDTAVLFKEPVLKTPPQLEKALGKKNPLVEKIATLTVRSPARPTVTTADDPRPKWVEAAGSDEFGVVP